jgi:hypothetical protein
MGAEPHYGSGEMVRWRRWTEAAVFASGEGPVVVGDNLLVCL